MPVIEQKTTNKNKVDFDLNRLDKSKTTIFSKYPEKNTDVRAKSSEKSCRRWHACAEIPQHFYQQKQLAYCTCKQPQMHRSAVELRRSRSFIPLKAASIPAKNRLGSTKNSLKEQRRNS